MIFHLSIDADDPKRVATALANLWGCEAYPFPPVAEGSWIVLIDDGRGSAIEVYPRGTVLAPGEGEEMAQARQVAGERLTPTHFAVATPWSEATVREIAAAEGWRVTTQSRGGRFDVIEVWIENRVMVEVLTDEMQDAYLAATTPGAWAQMLAQAA
jgi:hypothetical protein